MPSSKADNLPRVRVGLEISFSISAQREILRFYGYQLQYPLSLCISQIVSRYRLFISLAEACVDFEVH